MSRAQALSEILLQNFRSLRIYTCILSKKKKKIFCSKMTYSEYQTQRKNRQPAEFAPLQLKHTHYLIPHSASYLTHTSVSSSLLLSALSTPFSSFCLPFSSSFLLLASPPSFHLPLSAVPFLLTDLAIISCRPP